MLWGRPVGVPIVWSPIESRRFIGWWRGCRHRRSYVASLYWRTRHLLLRFLCLHEAAILALLLRFFLAQFWSFSLVTSSFALRRLQYWSSVLLAVKCHGVSSLSAAMFSLHREWRPDPHSKCVKWMGFSHALEAVYGISKCKFCENPPH